MNDFPSAGSIEALAISASLMERLYDDAAFTANDQRRISGAMVATYVLSKNAVKDFEIERAIRTDEHLAKIASDMLKSQARAFIPIAIAADTGDSIAPRKAEGITVNFHVSRAGDGQTYAIFEIASKLGFVNGDEPTLSVQEASNTLHKRLLPPLVEGRSQILLASDDPLLAALKDKNSVICLL